MKRRLILLAAVIALLAGFGALLHSPPSFMDVVTGATPKAKKAAQAKMPLKGTYLFGMNTDAADLKDSAYRQALKAFVLGRSDTLPGKNKLLTLYVSNADYALTRYADHLCARLRQKGVAVKLKTYSDTMLRSRIVAGRYEAFLSANDFVKVSQLKHADSVKLNSRAMKRTMKRASK